MKKMNKKGFTLAELLIVIAIIAVLIAIAIPTFSGALDNARRQTDHANLRAAYSVMQVAKLTGDINGEKPSDSAATTTWYMQKDGSFSSTATDASTTNYKTKAAGDATCADANGCPGSKDSGTSHEDGKSIAIVYTAAHDDASGNPVAASWSIELK